MWTIFEHIWIIFKHIRTIFGHTFHAAGRQWTAGGGRAAGGRAADEWRSHLFCACMKTKKTRTARTIILPAVSRRDLCYVSENSRFRFYNIRTIFRTSPSISKGWRRRLLSPDEFKKVRSRKRTAPRRIANRKQTGISNPFEPQFAIRNSIRIANTSAHYAPPPIFQN